MPIEELRKDAEEFSKLLAEATRRRVKDAIIAAKAEVDREIVTLEIKAKQAEERKTANTQKRYVTELSEYAWDQSDKYVKLFITLDGVQNIAEDNVTIKFSDNSMQLHVSDLNGKDYGLTINKLLGAIDAEKSYRKIKSGMVAVYMKKEQEGQHWETLTTVQKRLKEKRDQDLKAESESPDDALVNIMKKMYNSGDSQTKQMIAKAWTESQQKVHNLGDSSMPM